MKFVIDIPSEIYENAQNDLLCCLPILTEAIKNGTPLPEHYGRLIDATVAAANIEAARYELSNEYDEGLHEAWEIVNSEDAVPTIIPATRKAKILAVGGKGIGKKVIEEMVKQTATKEGE